MKKLKFTNIGIGFRELKNEVTLLVNISNCPFRCKGCHSPELWGDNGEYTDALKDIFRYYENNISAICFMGHGSKEMIPEMISLLKETKELFPKLSLGLYSGFETMFEEFRPYLSYYKVGAYTESLGALNESTTNQHMYKLKNGLIIGEDFFY